MTDKYDLYDERGELLDCLAYSGYWQETEQKIDDLTDQINLVEGVRSIGDMHDPRTATQQGADEDAADLDKTLNDMRASTYPI